MEFRNGPDRFELSAWRIKMCLSTKRLETHEMENNLNSEALLLSISRACTCVHL